MMSWWPDGYKSTVKLAARHRIHTSQTSAGSQFSRIIGSGTDKSISIELHQTVFFACFLSVFKEMLDVRWAVNV